MRRDRAGLAAAAVRVLQSAATAEDKALLGSNTSTIVQASLMLAADNDLPLHKIVTRKAGVDHTTRQAKAARKVWRKNRAKLGKPGEQR